MTNKRGIQLKTSLAALALAAVLPITVSAADLDYSYADVGFSRTYSALQYTYPPFAGGQGYLLDGSFGLGPHWFLEGSYQQNQFHQPFPYAVPSGANATTLDAKSLRLGGGFHWAISDSADLVAHAELGRAKTNYDYTFAHYSDQHEDDRGYVVGLGLRVRPTAALELDLGLDHDDLGFGQQVVSSCGPYCYLPLQNRQEGSENVVSTALRYHFGRWGAGLEYRSSSFQSWRETLVSLRVNF